MVNELICEGLSATYRSGFVLGPLDVEFGTGITCLVGANGAGKSTLFRIIAGLQRPQDGSVRVIDEGHRGLGYLPQSPELPPRSSCADFLQFVAWVQGVPRSRRPEAVNLALERVAMADRARTKVKHLSGGMARRLAIAQAMVHDPAVLLLDEPTVGLDPRQRIVVRESLKTVSTNRVALISTHLVEDVRGLADRVLVLNSGQVIFDGSVPALEALSSDTFPGDTPLERALASLMDDDA